MQGLDYIATDGAKAFDDLYEVVDLLVDTENADVEWKKDTKQKLKVARRYLKIDYKSHLSVEDECGDHCITFAVSDPKNVEFSTKCQHNHTLVCERCQNLEEVLQDIFKKIQDSQLPGEQRIRVEHDYKKYETDISTWKSHLLRTVNQEIGKQTALNDLNDDGALIVMDWAMKYLPQKYREKMTDFFGKRGISWHVSAVITKKEGTDEFDVNCYVHTCSQISDIAQR